MFGGGGGKPVGSHVVQNLRHAQIGYGWILRDGRSREKFGLRLGKEINGPLDQMNLAHNSGLAQRERIMINLEKKWDRDMGHWIT